MGIYLYGHTGSLNHGSEAIIRSTYELFRALDDITVVTSSIEQDKTVQLEKLVKLLPYGTWESNFQKVKYALLRRILNNKELGHDILQKNFWEKIQIGDICFTVGGDTYCYGDMPHLHVMVDEMYKRKIRLVLWACSITPKAIDEKLKRHLEKYDLIVARENITYQALISNGISKSKIVRTCDPAFWLKKEEIELPIIFNEKEVVGINISGFLVGNSEKGRNVFKSLSKLVHKILELTQFNICFIPHCYGKNSFGLDDVYYAREIYNVLSIKEKQRVVIIEKEMPCTKLKYIISNCRFFVGARTHSIIAAYSSYIPALALGYSVKSYGIARDIFGTDKGYVFGIDELQEEDNLWKAFVKMMNEEEMIIEKYKKNIPEYKNTILEVVKRIENMR